MNYRSHFKKSSGKIVLPEGVDAEQLKKGIKTEKEHTKDVGIAAKIALDHLKEDPKYYDKLLAAGLEENDDIKPAHKNTGWEADVEIGKMQDDPSHRPSPFGKSSLAKDSLAKDSLAKPSLAKSSLAKDEHCGVCDDDIEENDGLPKMGGALAIPHIGQPIHMSKIISVGGLDINRPNGTASGDLSGYTSVGKGVTKDAGGIPANVEGDKEPITAGGKKLDNNIATKSVGGQVVPGEGQTQGGPNTKGTIANTAKMNEAKKKIGSMVKEALKEIRFDKKSGKWVRITENTVDMKMGPSYKVANPQYRTQDQDQARTVQYDPEITEMYDEEEIAKKDARLSELLNAKRNLTAEEIEEMNGLLEASYKVAPQPSLQTADDNVARTNQTEPKVTEDSDVGDDDFGIDTEDPNDDLFGDAGDAGACPECGNTKGNIGMGRTAQCGRCGTDYEVEREESPEDVHGFDPELSDRELGKIAQLDVKPEPEDIDEAGGQIVQHRSFRTVDDLPQKKDARWSDEVDENTEPPKESETVKKIKKGQKPQKAAKPDQLKHLVPRKSKSGVHKKDK